jgi:phosphoglycerol transferase
MEQAQPYKPFWERAPFDRPRVRAVLAVSGVLAGSLAVAALVLKLWEANLDVPFIYRHDANATLAFIKNLIEHGTVWQNPDLGYPIGQELYDYPASGSDVLLVLGVRLLGLVSSDPAMVMNLFFLLSFPLVGGSAFLSLRLLGFSRGTAGVLACLVAILPYHFIRGERHLFLAAYWSVPLGAFFVLAVLEGRPLLARGDGGRPWLRPALVLGACLVIGLSGLYYAIFAALLLVVAGLVRAAGARTLRAGFTAAALIAVIGATVVVTQLPAILHARDDGANPTLERAAGETESYGLKLAAMVLPVEGHRIGKLAELRSRYDAGQQSLESTPQALGIVGVAGLLALAIFAIALLTGGRGTAQRGPPSLAGNTALAAGTAFVFGTVGGISSVLAYLGLAELRSWSRISVYVAFFALVGIGLLVEQFRARRGGVAAAVLLSAILVIGYLDQTNVSFAPSYNSVADDYETDGEFVAAIDQALPDGAAILQLPYEPFPESQPEWLPRDLKAYDLARGYIHSKHLRWSWGVMKGRNHDWQAKLVDLPPGLVARAAVALGFQGIYIDRYGYIDGGYHLQREISRELGGLGAAGSANQRLAFFDLRKYAADVRSAHQPAELRALAGATLVPLSLDWSTGFSARRDTYTARMRLALDRAVVYAHNPSPQPRRATVYFRVAAPRTRAQLTIRWPDGESERLEVDNDGEPVSRELMLAPGDNAIGFRTQGPPEVQLPEITRAYSLRIINPVLVDSTHDPFGALGSELQPASFLSPFDAS